MSEYAPQALFALFDAIKAKVPSAVLSGIQGDTAHTYGYHRSRNVLPASDYSRVLGPDREGDGDACAALDISLSPELMVAVTQRLMTAMRNNDGRVAAVREFFGTLDHVNVTGWDRHDPTRTVDDSYTTSDDSHLWHIHLSVYRKYATNTAALLPIADVIAGEGETTSSNGATRIGDDDDVTPDDVKAIATAAAAAVWTANFKAHGFDAPASTVLADTLRNATTAAGADPMGKSLSRSGVGPAPREVWLADARNLAAQANDNAAKALAAANEANARLERVLAALDKLAATPAQAGTSADPKATVAALGAAITKGVQ